ncbi:bifunctional sugar phosphate isomerase/epimerase/4-hydroxyphenylpyruvate dioxygenase family protein [Saccharospirillum alexandrii]|uniref:bifunctional sugar phosphate isomerase/epimerase/4-hydroxyphenylpyruvate dioxygenase family protein n=1 Tax=Saccharospirillum alexandrii TaxID=2448477 RepID=UPI000FDC6895|nr:sugar phosphate isomerase/epimerase and 4-hydroxyphenylpyruvate domain-containing protein [Saccharospirillum alexandrii]
MYSSIATVCLSGALSDKINAIADAGFEGIEIFENDLTAFNGTAREAGQLIRDRGMTLVTLQPFRDFEGLEGRDRQRAFDRAERKFDLMEELGTDLLMCCSSVHPNAKPGIARAAEDYAELGDRAAKRGLRIAFEALAWGTHIHDYRDSWEVVRRADHASVGLVLDTFHIFSRQTELDTLASIPGDRIFLVQTADAPRLSMDHLSWSRHYRCFPGQGELQMQQFMERLSETRYDGALSHEIFNDVFRMGHSDQTARDGMHSYRLLRTMADQSSVPAPQPVERLAFIEIAINPDRADVLRTDLAALGLRCVGKHAQVAAERWAMNDLNVVINTERDFAGRVPGREATSVSAFGVQVDNAYQAIKRARKLGYDLVEPKDVNASHDMTAMRNVDGSLAYIVDASQLSKVWDTEFTVDTQPVPKGPVVEVDHLSLSLSYHDYLSVMLQYRSVFALEPTASFDVTDPKGLIQSQVLHNSGEANQSRRFRLALNASASPETTSNRLVKKVGGSGVQHIALRTQDMTATVAGLADAHTPTLTIPVNYYRDLQARYELGESEVQWMQDHSVLYDEDGTGEFRQLYVRPDHQSFFFELVQRDGYQGLGAPNAFVRAAAQQQADALANPSADTQGDPLS